MTTTRPQIDISDAVTIHRRLARALRRKNAERATSILAREYLPALRDLSATIEPERVDDYVASLVPRLESGYELVFDTNDVGELVAHEVIGHDDAWLAMLDVYETGVDLQGMRHPPGDLRHTANVLMDRIGQCRRG